MPYHVANLDTPSTSILWPLGGSVTLNWTTPPQAPDHIIIWRNSAPDWASATELATLAGSATTYNDPTATIDGTPFYYWVICYNAGGNGAGFNNGVQGCQNNNTVTGATVVGSFGGCTLQQTVPFSNDIDPGGLFDAFLSFSWAGTTNNPSNFSAGLAQDVSPHPLHYLAFANAPDGNSGSGSAGPNIGISPSVFTQLDISWGVINAGYVFPGPDATITGVDGNAQVAYTSPAATGASGGAGGGGGGVGTNPATGQITLGVAGSLPVPLPCIPCCQTDMPICDWSTARRKPALR